MKELKKTIDELKQKFMGLVEEKLQLQVTVDSLEHQFVEVDLDLGNDNKKGIVTRQQDHTRLAYTSKSHEPPIK